MTKDVRGIICTIISGRLLQSERTLKDDDRIIIDLGADSLDFAEIAMDLEDAFNFRLEDGEEEKIRTIGDAVALVKAKIAAREEKQRAQKAKTELFTKPKVFAFSSLVKVIEVEAGKVYSVTMGSKTITSGSEEYCHHIASLLDAGLKALSTGKDK